jgi:integrase
MKSHREHRVPLSRAALAIVENLHELRQGEFVFPGQRGRLDGTTMKKLLEPRMNGIRPAN